MRGKSSSSKSKNCGLDMENSEKLKEPHLSGAYIRSLVKHLSSSRTKDSSNSKEHEDLEGDGISNNQNLCRNTCDGFSDQNQEKSHHQPPQQHKKQVRRRLHTTRPYQERLLNMAEARREIVTALKFHRAAMKQASEKQQQQQTESRPEIKPFESSSHQLSLEQEANLKSRRNPRIYASNSSILDNFPPGYLDNCSYSPGCYSSYSWCISPIPPPLLVQENLNFTLPSQTLGLNLNLQDFNNLDSAFHCISNPSSIYSSSSPSTSSSPLSATTEEIPCMGAPISSVAAVVAEFGDSGLHPAMDDKEMDEIRSIGEQYQMEWNDTLNLVNSAWWFKFLKAMEMTPENEKGEDFFNCPFDEVVEFPAWLNANESCLQQVNDFCSDIYFQDPALPCMDIEEIEGIDGDWLA